MVQFEPVTVLGVTIPAGALASFDARGVPLGPLGLAAGASLGAWVEWAAAEARGSRAQLGSVGAGAAPLARMFTAAALAAAAAALCREPLADECCTPLLEAARSSRPYSARSICAARCARASSSARAARAATTHARADVPRSGAQVQVARGVLEPERLDDEALRAGFDVAGVPRREAGALGDRRASPPRRRAPRTARSPRPCSACRRRRASLMPPSRLQELEAPAARAARGGSR